MASTGIVAYIEYIQTLSSLFSSSQLYICARMLFFCSHLILCLFLYICLVTASCAPHLQCMRFIHTFCFICSFYSIHSYYSSLLPFILLTTYSFHTFHSFSCVRTLLCVICSLPFVPLIMNNSWIIPKFNMRAHLHFLDLYFTNCSVISFHSSYIIPHYIQQLIIHPYSLSYIQHLMYAMDHKLCHAK